MAINIVKAEGLETLEIRQNYGEYLKVMAVKESEDSRDVDVYIGEAGSHRDLIRDLIGNVYILGGCDLGIIDSTLYLGGKPAGFELLTHTLRERIAVEIMSVMRQSDLEVPTKVIAA